MSNFPFRTTRDRPGCAGSGRVQQMSGCQDVRQDQPASQLTAAVSEARMHASGKPAYSHPTTYEVSHSRRHRAIMKHATTTEESET